MFVDLLLGLQWGDEGKGKIVDAISEEYSMISRFQGGPNAGHTIKIGSKSIFILGSSYLLKQFLFLLFFHKCVLSGLILNTKVT